MSSFKQQNEIKRKAAIKIQKVWRGHHIYVQFKQILSTYLHPLDDIADIDIDELESWYTPPEDLLLFDLEVDSFPSSFSVHHMYTPPPPTQPSSTSTPLQRQIANSEVKKQPEEIQPLPSSSLINNSLPSSPLLSNSLPKSVLQEDWYFVLNFLKQRNFTSEQAREAYLRRQQKLDAMSAYSSQKTQTRKHQSLTSQKVASFNEFSSKHSQINSTSPITIPLTMKSVSEPNSRVASASQPPSIYNSAVNTPNSSFGNEQPMLRTSSFDSLPTIVHLFS